MLAKLRGRLTYSNVVSTICLCLVVGGGSAYAVNTIGSSDVIDESLLSQDFKDGEVRNSDVATGAIGPAKVADNSLTGTELKTNSLNGREITGLTGSDIADNSLKGADVDEANLGQVPLAVLGGIGRWDRAGGECDPGSEALATCAVTTINLPSATHVLLLGVVKAQAGSGAGATGQCLLSSQDGGFGSSMSGFSVGGTTNDPAKFIPLMYIPGVRRGPGLVSFGVACQEVAGSGDLRICDAAVTAVALSPN